MFGAVSAAVGALVGALVEALGQSITQTIVSGIIFGIGGGFQEMCFARAQELVPNKWRFQTLFPSLLPSVVTAIMLYFFYYPPTFETKHKDGHKTKWQLVKDIDYIGLILFTGGCLLVLLTLNWAMGSIRGTAQELSLASLLAFCASSPWDSGRQTRLSRTQFSPLTSSRSGDASQRSLSMNVIWPRQSGLLGVPADKPIIRGVYATMVSFSTIAAGWYCVGLMPWIKHEKRQPVACIVIQTALIGSLAAICTSIQTSEFGKLLPGAVRTAAETTGFDGSMNALLTATKANTPVAYSAVEGITTSTITAVQRAVLISNSKSYKTVYLVAIAFGCVAIASALSVKPIDSSQRSNQVAAKSKNERKDEGT
ncbi:hypothetical protein B0T10DRAFT_543134 [Thelonectria olida]|uniref:Uncharacterized protein n=1 Tax=Thelonectria olida TaxID=1576542 RepID=A0A9P8WET5_9HYPO|nr:hypothetical protein B0T10DRAFT_543134 [Thelonectria olida]